MTGDNQKILDFITIKFVALSLGKNKNGPTTVTFFRRRMKYYFRKNCAPFNKGAASQSVRRSQILPWQNHEF